MEFKVTAVKRWRDGTVAIERRNARCDESQTTDSGYMTFIWRQFRNALLCAAFFFSVFFLVQCGIVERDLVLAFGFNVSYTASSRPTFIPCQSFWDLFVLKKKLLSFRQKLQGLAAGRILLPWNTSSCIFGLHRFMNFSQKRSDGVSRWIDRSSSFYSSA